MKKIICCIFLFCIFPVLACAKQLDYVNENYDTSHIKNVLVICQTSENQGTANDSQIKFKIYNMLRDSFIKKNNDIKFTVYTDLEKQIDKGNNILDSNLHRANEFSQGSILPNYPDKFDAVLVVDIIKYSEETHHVPEKTYHRTEHMTPGKNGIDIYGDGRGYSVDLPDGVIPAEDIRLSTVMMDFKLIDNTGKIIFMRKDDRTRHSGNLGGKGHAIDVADRMIKSCVGKILHILG